MDDDERELMDDDEREATTSLFVRAWSLWTEAVDTSHARWWERELAFTRAENYLYQAFVRADMPWPYFVGGILSVYKLPRERSL